MKHVFSLMRGGPVALLILLWLAGPAARAQAPAWQTAINPVSSSATSNSQVSATATDGNGNVYLTGSFSGAVSFGGTTLTSTGATDIFVAKCSTSGFVWVQQVGGAGDESANSIAVRGTTVYIAGGFNSSSLNFGSTALLNANTSGYDLFVAKLTDAGNTSSFTWALKAGGTGDDGASNIAVNGPNVYVSGRFSSPSLAFGNTTLTNIYTGPSSYDVFVTKLTDAGPTASFTWAQSVGGDDKIANGLAVSGTSVYIAGSFTSTAILGNITLSGVNGSLFFAKLTDQGTTATFIWAQQGGGINAIPNGIAVNGSNVYIAGFFYGTAASFGTTTLANVGDREAFVAKLTDAGNTGSFSWAQRAGGTSGDGVYTVAVSGTSVYIAGHFASPTADFGPITLTNATNTSFSDVFVAKLTDAGSTSSFIWAQRAGGVSSDIAYGLVLTGTTIYVAGTVRPPSTFGGLPITGPAGAITTFLASLTDPTLLATTPALSGSAFTLAPNPARTTATLTLPALPGTATATLTLRDALGRAIRTAVVNLPAAGLRHELDLTGLPAGLYAVQVQAGAASATRRLVVE